MLCLHYLHETHPNGLNPIAKGNLVLDTSPTLIITGSGGKNTAANTITFNVILRITNAISKNLPSSSTKWLPIMTYIHPLHKTIYQL
jgi:hypothetical protein